MIDPSTLGWLVAMSMEDCVKKLIDVERSSLLWAASVPRQGVLNSVKREIELSIAEKYTLISLFSSCGYDVTHCPKFLP